MTPPRTATDLLQDLQALGVSPGDVLFMHSSYKSLGEVDGGAATVIEALQRAVGPEGTILMPSFNLVEGDSEARATNWDIDTTPSTAGYLTEFFRQMPGTVRSDHYSHSVAARGKDAEWFVAGHREMTGMTSPWDLTPWGLTYGDQSPMIRVMDHPGSKLLMLGVDYKSSTYQHVVEVIDWHRRLADDPEADLFTFKPRQKLGEYWEQVGQVHVGLVGQATCRLFEIKSYVEALAAEVARAGEVYCPWHPKNYEKDDGE